MAKILVYNNDSNKMETYYRGENESMPYITRRYTYCKRVSPVLVLLLRYGLVSVLCKLGIARDIFGAGPIPVRICL